MTVFGKRLLQATVAAIALAAAATPPTWAVAQTSTTTETRAFNVPAGPINQAVLTLSNQAGVQVVMEAGSAGFVRSSAVRGRMTFDQALNQLLSGTGLTWRWLRPGVATIERVQTSSVNADGEIELGAIRVEGATGAMLRGATSVNGINGSSDVTATEGTGSYTSNALTVGSRTPQSIQDTPQSVSVLTAERLQDQQISDYTTALAQIPGVSLVQGATSLENTFYSRGFAIEQIAVDGGAPLLTGFSSNNLGGSFFYPQIDLSQYDHVEILRGANGFLSGYGSPGGTVNLVRKKPLDRPQTLVEMQAGSWKYYRAMLDITGPLAFDGRLKGRLVSTYQSNDFFYRDASDKKSVLYGIAEFALSDRTDIWAGVSYTDQDSVPWKSGLMRYQNGDDLRLPRSTSFVFPWNRWDFRTTELFAGFRHSLSDRWTLNLNLTKSDQETEQALGWAATSVNLATGRGARMFASFDRSGSDQLSADFNLNGEFDVWGQTQKLTIGGTYSRADGGGDYGYPDPLASSISNPYVPFPGGPRFCNNPVVNSVCPGGRTPR